jgi:hypothetical protein
VIVIVVVVIAAARQIGETGAGPNDVPAARGGASARVRRREGRCSAGVARVMQHRGQLPEPDAVLLRVVIAKKQLTARRQDCADHSCGSAAITTVGGGECSWTGQSSGHCRPPIVGHRRRWRYVTHR